MEEWRDIPGFEGRYQISSLGRVKSLARNDRKGRFIFECIRKLTANYNGYLYVKIWREQHAGHMAYEKYFVHRLVGIVFLPNPHAKPVVNHKDRNRQNNCVENLEWATDSENMLHWIADNKRIAAAAVADEPLNLADIPF